MANTYGPEYQESDTNSLGTKLTRHLFNRLGDFEFTIADESSNAIAVTIQCLDTKGRNLPRYVVFDVILSEESWGEPNAAFDSVTATTGTILSESPISSVITVQSNNDGKAVLSFVTTGTTDYYIRARCGDIVVQASDQLEYS